MSDEGVVEAGFVVADERVFHGSGFGFCWLYGKDYGGEPVVVSIVVPPSDCKLAFGMS